MQKWQKWESASDADWGLAVEREAVIRPLAERKRLCEEEVEEAVHHLRIGRSLLYKLVHRYRQRPQTSSLLPLKRGRDTNTTVMDQTREHLLDSCIREFYLRPERPSFAALIQEIRRQFSERQLAVPNYRTVKRRVEGLDLRLVMRKREGSKKAHEKLGQVNISTLRPECPPDVLQMDHTPVDVIVVNNSVDFQSVARGFPWQSTWRHGWWPAFTSLSGLHPLCPSPSPFRTQSCPRPIGWRIENCRISNGRWRDCRERSCGQCEGIPLGGIRPRLSRIWHST